MNSKDNDKMSIKSRIPLESLDIKRLIQLDACTRCGECMPWCPVYDQDPNESIIPRRKIIDFLKIIKFQEGPVAKIIEKSPSAVSGLLKKIFNYQEITDEQIESFVANLYECSTCGQCEVVCPARIDTVSLWEELRSIIVKAGLGPLEPQKALRKSVMAYDNPWQQPRAGRTKWARRAKKEGLIKEMPRDIKKTGGKVLLFFGCTAAYDTNVKQVAINTINILEALDVDYGVLGADEKCCGSVLLRMGDPEYRRLFKENIDMFNELGIETLISSCSGCFKTILQDYPKVAPLNFEVLHTVEFLARLLKQGRLDFRHPVKRRVTYHDPCHLGRATEGFEAPRMIMEAVPGLELVEMPRNREYSRCCGAGGGLKAGYPEIQNKMAQRRIKEAEATGASELVSCCPFCFQGLNIGITALESPIIMKDMSAIISLALLGYDASTLEAEKEANKAVPVQKKREGSTEDAPPSRRLRRESRRQKREEKHIEAEEAPAEAIDEGEKEDNKATEKTSEKPRRTRRASRRAKNAESIPVKEEIASDRAAKRAARRAERRSRRR